MKIEKLALVIPVYNESEIIASVVHDWTSALDKISGNQSTFQYSVLLYNDGSKDGTLKILRELEEKFSGKIRVFDEKNSGHGPTVLKGYRRAIEEGFDWIFQVDSDNEMTSEKFHILWDNREKIDFGVGRRSGRTQALPRKIVSGISRATASLLYGKGVWDVNTPYRLMRVAAMKDILLQIPADSFAPNVIISGMAARNKLRLMEIPVAQHERRTGTVSIKKWKLLNAAIQAFSETVEFALNRKNSWILLLIAAVFSLSAKLYLASTGYNFDYESYRIVADIMHKGGNVYVETERYNYGPVWFYVLLFLSTVSGPLFRYAVPLFLGLADIGIAALLWKKYRLRVAALIFMLSPLSIQISGFHNQFDNVAVLLMLCAGVILSESDDPSLKRVLTASVITGISLITKHVFIFFVFWFLFRNYTWKKKLLLFLIPLTMFGAGFLPYIYPWSTASVKNIKEDTLFLKKQCSVLYANKLRMSEAQKTEIKEYDSERFKAAVSCINNVFRYRSFNNSILYNYYLPKVVQFFISPYFLFLAGVLFSGWLCRKKTVFDGIIFYCISLVLFSIATANQYLAIPLVGTSVCYLPFGLLYNLIPGAVLMVNNASIQTNMYIFCIGLLLVIYIDFLQRSKSRK